MDKLKSRYTGYAFKVARGLPSGITGTAVVDLGSVGFNGENIVEFRSGAGAVQAAQEVAGAVDWFDQNTPTYIYIDGSDNYDGLRRVYNLRGGRFPQIFAPYVAETPSGSFFHVGYKAETASEFGGFSVHFEAAYPISIDLIVTIISAKGSAFDNVVYTKDMLGVQDVNHMFKPPRFLAPDDRIAFTFAATGAMGIMLYVRKLS